jgi:hypothetical protein
MATLDIAQFRARFPEFTVAKYPDITLQVYFDMASVFVSVDGCPWQTLTGTRLDLVLQYMTAHLLALQDQAKAAGPGGATTSQGGFQTSATIGEISVAKLAPPATGAWDWWLYQTQYGTALMALLQTLAVGGFSVGGLNESGAFRRAGGVFL